MGHDWLRVVRLDWRKIGKVSATTASVKSRVAALQEQYQEVFSETLGTITPFTAKAQSHTWSLTEVFQASIGPPGIEGTC